ncbi:MAG: hypothetical protein ABI969_18615, partial [bacterium]
MRIAPLRSVDRDRVCELLIATGSFSLEEVDVALELFDLCHPERAQRVEGSAPLCHPERAQRVEGSAPKAPDYELVGAYDDADTLLGYACFGPTPTTTGTYDLYWL